MKRSASSNIIVAVAFSVFTAHFSFSQNKRKIDSLFTLIKTNTHDTVKVFALNALAREYWHFDPDSALPILQTAYDKANAIGFKRGISGTLLYIAFSYLNLSQIDSSISLYKRSIRYSEKNNFKKNLSSSYSGLAADLYSNNGEYSEAIKYYLKAIRVQEEMKDSIRLGKSYNGIGTLFYKQGDHKQAKAYLLKGLVIKEKTNDLMAMTVSYNSLGMLSESMKNYSEALDYYNKAIASSSKISDLKGLALTLSNAASLYGVLGRRDDVISSYEKALEIYRQIHDLHGKAVVLLNLGITYGERKNYSKAEEYLIEAERSSENLSDLTLLMDLYHALYDLSYNTGKYKLACEYGLKQNEIKDSIYNMGKMKEINSLNTQFQTELKDKELIAKNAEIENHKLEAKQQSILRNAFIVGFVLVLLLAIFIFRGYKQKQKANEIITEQKRIVEAQKALVEEHQKEILDSIHYAKRIQSALITSEKYIEKSIDKLNKN